MASIAEFDGSLRTPGRLVRLDQETNAPAPSEYLAADAPRELRPGVDVDTRVVSIVHFRGGRQLERWLRPDNPEAWALVSTSSDEEGARGR